MGQPTVGSIVLIKFPFSDFKSYKKRPAMVVACGSMATVIVCQITSRLLPGVPSVTVSKKDFTSGGLPVVSYVRPDKLFTVDTSMTQNKELGTVTTRKINSIRSTVAELFE